jgi:hypothetical protein
MAQIIKQADFIESFIGSVKDHTNFKDKPFETIFGLMGPLVLWKINWMLGALGFIGEALGYGPGLLGKYVDDYLKTTMKDGKADLSDNNLQGAAEHAAKQLLESSAIETESALKEIFLIKKSLSLQDFVAAAYTSRDFPIVRTAGFMSQIKRMFSGRGMFSRITGVLTGLLKKFALGFAGVGIASGLLSTVGITKTKEAPEGEKPAPSGEPTAVGMQHYTNVGNVEDTLIMYLDATIANFSTSFAAITKTPLKGSARMKNVLQEVAKRNWAKIENIDSAKAFVAPSPLVLAKMLLPEAKYEPIDKEPASKAEPGKMVSTPGKKTQRVPTKTTDPKAELKDLLQGVLK